MTDILSEIIDRKREAVAQLRANHGPENFRARALAARAKAVPHRLLQALASDSRQLNIIAEFKRRSPSAGLIRGGLSAAWIARCYERGGSCAFSGLTEQPY